MRQRQPSKAAQGWGSLAFARWPFVVIGRRVPILDFSALASVEFNSTSAKITPLQQRPHSRQRLVEPVSLTAVIMSFPARNRKERPDILFPLPQSLFHCKVTLRFPNNLDYEH